jgi:hypothetical protein
LSLCLEERLCQEGEGYVIVSKAVGELRKNFQMTFPTSSLG